MRLGSAFESLYADMRQKGAYAPSPEQIGRLVEWLASTGLDRRTIVVVVGDHGESLGSHGESTHGYFIYDTLFASDENYAVKPQMVDTWKVSDDKLTWTFTLRDGLEFHDGTPVTSAAAVGFKWHSVTWIWPALSREAETLRAGILSSPAW